MPSLYDRVADDKDSLRGALQAARSWGVHPTVFLRERTVDGPWTDRDTAYARALAWYEAQLCGGCGGFLPETTRPAREVQYAATLVAECGKCVARQIRAEAESEKPHSYAFLYSTTVTEKVPA